MLRLEGSASHHAPAERIKVMDTMTGQARSYATATITRNAAAALVEAALEAAAEIGIETAVAVTDNATVLHGAGWKS